MTKIGDDEAKRNHGVWTDHELMDNGELRFRLKDASGNGYIRTVASSTGGWQVAHLHKILRETYIVERGWMALAERRSGGMSITVHRPNDLVTISSEVVHNVYLSSKAVVHTLKHGSAGLGDWKEDAAFTKETRQLTEDLILKVGMAPVRQADPRFDGYIRLYNNLDRLVWRIPGFLVAGAAILIGFAGAVLSQTPSPEVPPAVAGGLFIFLGLLFFLSAFSIRAFREHHAMVGEELRHMEVNGYFHQRRHTLARRWPPSATLVFMLAYLALCVTFWALAVVSFVEYDLLVRLGHWRPGG